MSRSKNTEYERPINIEITGATAPDGTPHVCIAASGKTAWLPLSAFTGGGAEALRMLKSRGMPLLTAEWKLCRSKVAELKLFPILPLIDRPGWNETHFALPDGTVFSSSDDVPVVLFEKAVHKCAEQGSIGRWRTLTAHLKDQPLATFVLLAAYAGPFVSLCDHTLNVGFELAGPPGVGKSTLLRLAAAVCGPADDPSGQNYWITANATINGLEQAMREHSDMAFIIDECNLYAAADHVAARAAKMNELVFKLSDGSEKRRFRSGRPQRSRFVFFTSTNEPLVEVLYAHRVAVAEAACDRLLTIPIDPGRPLGAFNCLPNRFDNPGAFAEYLNRKTRKCHGVGIRQLLQRLVDENARNPKAVSDRLRGYLARFRREVEVDGHDGSQTRVADQCGLVYAAGEFAIGYGAVSKHLDPLEAAKFCYHLNRASRPQPIDRLKHLRELADDFDTMVLVQGGRRFEMSDEEVNHQRAFVIELRKGGRELLLTQRQLEREVADLKGFFADPTVQRVMVTEQGRRQTKRQIRSNVTADRVYCFRLAELD